MPRERAARRSTVGDVGARRSSAPSSCRTWSPTPGPPGTGTSCTTTPSTSRPSACRHPWSTARCSAPCSPSSCRTGSGPRAVLRTLHFRFKDLVFAGETVRCVATVTAVEPDPDGAGDCVTVESTVEVVGDKGRVAVAPRRRDGGRAAMTTSRRARRAPPSATSASPAAACSSSRRRPSRVRSPTPVSRSATSTAWRPTTSAGSRPTRSPTSSACGRRGSTRRSSAARRSRCYVARAAQAIEAGQAAVVVVSYATNQRSARSRSLGGVLEEHLPEAQFETPYGPLFPLSYYAMAAQALPAPVRARPRATSREVAVSAREWALLNPAGVPPRGRSAHRRRRARVDA